MVIIVESRRLVLLLQCFLFIFCKYIIMYRKGWISFYFLFFGKMFHVISFKIFLKFWHCGLDILTKVRFIGWYVYATFVSQIYKFEG